jgi:HEAT repeat protein
LFLGKSSLLLLLLVSLSGCATEGAELEAARAGGNVAALCRAAETGTSWVAGDAARALGRTGGGCAADALIALLARADAGPWARGEAAFALGKLQAAAAAPALLSALERAGHPEERYALVWALGRMCTPEAVSALEEHVSDTDLFVSRAARKGLLECGKRRAESDSGRGAL